MTAEQLKASYRARAVKTGGWTPDEDKTMLELREAGLTQLDIGLKIGRSRTAVERRLKRIDAPKVRLDWKPEEIEQFKELYVSGASIDQIVKKTGRSVAAIKHMRQKAGIVRPPEVRQKITRKSMGKVADRYWTPERDAQLRQLWQQDGKTKKDTAAAIGCGTGAVSGRIHRLKLKRDASLGAANVRDALKRAWAATRERKREPKPRKRIVREPPLSAAEFKRLSDRAKEEARVKVMLSRMFNGPRAEGAVYRPKFL